MRHCAGCQLQLYSCRIRRGPTTPRPPTHLPRPSLLLCSSAAAGTATTTCLS